MKEIYDIIIFHCANKCCCQYATEISLCHLFCKNKTETLKYHFTMHSGNRGDNSNKCKFYFYRFNLPFLKCNLAFYKCNLAFYKCNFAFYKCNLAFFKWNLAFYKCNFAFYKCNFAFTRVIQLFTSVPCFLQA